MRFEKITKDEIGDSEYPLLGFLRATLERSWVDIERKRAKTPDYCVALLIPYKAQFRDSRQLAFAVAITDDMSYAQTQGQVVAFLRLHQCESLDTLFSLMIFEMADSMLNALIGIAEEKCSCRCEAVKV